MRFTIVSPPAPTIKYFGEALASLIGALRSLGHEADFCDTLRSGTRHIALMSHAVCPEYEFPEGTILYNFEPRLSPELVGSPSYWQNAQKYTVWDYSATNVSQLKAAGKYRDDARYVPMGYVPELTHLPHLEDVGELDILFAGSFNERRAPLIKKLLGSSVRIGTIYGLAGEARGHAMAETKVIFAPHFREGYSFEALRIVYAMANGKCVVCEDADDMPPVLRPGLIVAPYDQLAETAVGAVLSGRWREVGEEALRRVQQMPMTEILAKVLDADRELHSEQLQPPASAAWLPCVASGAD